MTECPDLSLFQAVAALRSGAVTSRALVQAVPDRIGARKDLNTSTDVAADALAQADRILARSAVAPLTAAMLAAMDGVDLILTATTLTPALAFSAFDGEKAVWTPMRTIRFNLTGQPALSFPVGFLTRACALARNWWAASSTTTLSAPPPTPLNAAPTTPPSARLDRVAPAHQIRGASLNIR